MGAEALVRVAAPALCWPPHSLPRPGEWRREDSVHVWCAWLDAPGAGLQRLSRLLSEDERARADRFHFGGDRRRFVVARAILRQLLGAYLGCEPSELRFRYGSHGKPALEGEPALEFSMSHSGGLALVAVAAGRRLGVDLERVRPVVDRDLLAARFFSVRENADLKWLPAAEKQTGFFNCWTRKEAYVKATGEGLARPLESFDVSLVPGQPARLLFVEDNPEEVARWWIAELAPAAGYAAALAVEGRPGRLDCRQWMER